MKVFFALTILIGNFVKSAFLSGINTAKVILVRPRNNYTGVATMNYSELDTTMASLLGAMITLTPGVTLIEIDTHKQKMTLHLLETDKKEAIFEAIDKDFVKHLKVIGRWL